MKKSTDDRTEKCDWVFDHEIRNKVYVKCSKCTRIKRKDLPDVQPCLGSSIAYKSSLYKSFGYDLSDNELKSMQKDIEHEGDVDKLIDDYPEHSDDIPEEY